MFLITSDHFVDQILSYPGSRSSYPSIWNSYLPKWCRNKYFIGNLRERILIWDRRSKFLGTDPKVRVRFPALLDFLSSVFGTGSTQPREYNWGATWKESGSGIESQEYGRRDPSRWPRGILYPQKLALASPISGGRSVGIVRSQTQATEFFHPSLKAYRRYRGKFSESDLDFEYHWSIMLKL
jgi:hypothetical protein